MTSGPRTPAGLGTAGRDAWTKLHAEYGFPPSEDLVVLEIARTADALAELDAQLRREGYTVTIPTKAGDQVKTNPAAVEARQLRLVQARLVASLRLPSGNGEQAPRRGARGVYRGHMRAVK